MEERFMGKKKSRLLRRKGSNSSLLPGYRRASQVNHYSIYSKLSRVIVKYTLGRATGAAGERGSWSTVCLSICGSKKSCLSWEAFQMFLWDGPFITVSVFSRMTTQPSRISKHKQNRKPWLVKNQVIIIL